MQSGRINPANLSTATLRARKSARARRRKRQRRLQMLRVCLFLSTAILIVGCSVWSLFGAKPAQKTDANIFSSLKDKPYTIVLDSGHSTFNVGAHGLVKEEEITAKTTEHLRQMLEQDERFQVILTHEYDVHATLAERRDVGITSGCDFFLSIHCNSTDSEDGDIHGFEIYTQLPENKQHEKSYTMANNIVQGLTAAGHSPRTGSGIFYCRYVPDENGNDVQYTLTEQEEASTNLGGTTYGVIKSEEYPAVLIEQGYVNSPQDVANWMSDDGTKAAAEIYYKALCDYFEDGANM